MPSNTEVRKTQKELLFDLLMLRRDAKLTIPRLTEMIARQEAAMEEEDVAWVEKKIAQLKGD